MFFGRTEGLSASKHLTIRQCNQDMDCLICTSLIRYPDAKEADLCETDREGGVEGHQSSQ
jgi:hypothetical protein